jgi:2'-5' RNA ligase
MKRLFIAVPFYPEPAFSESLNHLQQALKHDKIHWTQPQLMHFTLRFLGATEDSKIPEIRRTIATSIEDFAPFKIQLTQLGIFGSKYQPRVLWCGIEKSESFTRLHHNVEAGLQLPKPPQEGHYVPHLTLGRIQKIEDKPRFQRILDAQRNNLRQTVLVSEIILFQSILSQKIPVYKTIERFSLNLPELVGALRATPLR